MSTEKRTEAPDDALPDESEIQERLGAVRAFACRADCLRVRGFLERLSERPPQALLLEGATAALRLQAALYWTLLVNCRGASEDSAPGLPGIAVKAQKPCWACAACRTMAARMHRDMFFLDGLAGSIKIDDVRHILSVLGEPPREVRRRVIIFSEAQALVEAAANVLLKSMEEPREGTTFILLAPQRERLLPTLVSRSFTLTLPWLLRDEENAGDDQAVAWEAALCTFLDTGGQWFGQTGSRGAVDASVAQTVCSLCRTALARRMAALQSGEEPRQGLDERLARLPAVKLRIIDEILAECQDSLQFNVSPALVLDWMATRLYLLMPR